MYKLIVIVALCVVGMASAQKPCCWSSQFMAGNGGTVGEINQGQGQGFFTYIYGASDYSRRRFGFNMTVSYPDGPETRLRLIQEYAMDTQYIINDQERSCLKQEAQKPEPFRCIPDNAKYLSSFRTGGPDGLLQESWRLQYTSPPDPIEGTLVFSVARVNDTFCYPVGSSLIGDRFQGSAEVPMVSSAGILNITEGIVNPDQWFTLPDFCNNSSMRSSRSISEMDFFRIPKLF